jgi:hypothetical protein
LIQVNTWYHFVGVVGADYNTGFLNGNEMIGRRYNVGTQPTDHVWFGDLNSPLYCSTGRGILGTQTNWNYFDGQIDEIRLYDGPLGAAEVTRLYAQAFEPGDANFDGIVDLADFGLLKDRFGGPGTWRKNRDSHEWHEDSA